MRRALITGTAGFIGFHVAAQLLREGWVVAGFDGMIRSAVPDLKPARHAILRQFDRFQCIEARLEDAHAISRTVREFRPDTVIHLAAQAGVRHSIEEPRAFLDSNVVGTFNLLQAIAGQGVGHLLLASSSSVYGTHNGTPHVEGQNTDQQVSFYAASKKCAEIMAQAWSHVTAQPTTALRFFTVYGPWGRPDMAVFKFTRAILGQDPIELYNHGALARDFTYVDDVVLAVRKLIDAIPAAGGHGTSGDGVPGAAPFRAVNVGTGRMVNLEALVATLERITGQRAIRRYSLMQAGDVVQTLSDPGLLKRLTGFSPETGLEEGLSRFVTWYRGTMSKGAAAEGQWNSGQAAAAEVIGA